MAFLGACQTGGSVIDWVMRLGGVSFRHAVELLREGIPPLVAETTSPPRVVKQSTVPKLPAPVVSEADDHALLGQVIDYYHATLKQSPEALAYLQKRGLHHPDVIDHFKLGFANRTLGLRLIGTSPLVTALKASRPRCLRRSSSTVLRVC